MSTGFDMYVKAAKKRLQYLENYLDTARRVKEIVSAMFPEAFVYVFGSVVRGDFTAGSDLDVLVVVGREVSNDERAAVRAAVFQAMPDAPVELHVASAREFNNWYRRFIPETELVEV